MRRRERGLCVFCWKKTKLSAQSSPSPVAAGCNITNAESDKPILLKAYGKAEQFLYFFFRSCVQDTFAFFESRGLPLVVQAGKRAFPKSEKAEDVVKTLRIYLQAGKVIIKTGSVVTKIHGNKDGIVSVVPQRNVSRSTVYFFNGQRFPPRNRLHGRRLQVAAGLGAHRASANAHHCSLGGKRGVEQAPRGRIHAGHENYFFCRRQEGFF